MSEPLGDRKMNIILASDHEYLPYRVSGRESSIHDLACAFADMGHDVRVIARPSEITNATSIDPKTWDPPYNIERTEQICERTEELLRKNEASLAIYSIKNAPQKFSRDPAIGERQVVYVRDARELDSWSKETFPRSSHIVANSKFVADAIAARIGQLPMVIPPFINLSRYRTETSGEFVTFINPVPVKGVDVAIGIARACPNIPFQFVEGWPRTDEQLAELRAKLAGLSNVRFRRKEIDARNIYSNTRILLVPSQWEEGFGRVVIEAQTSGIPVIASRIGGLPEAVGRGGKLLSPDAPIRDWAILLHEVWRNPQKWQKLSKAAVQNAEAHATRTRNAAEMLISVGRPTEHSESRIVEGPSGDSLPGISSTRCSIVVIYDNHRETLDLALHSILEQTHKNYECVIFVRNQKPSHIKTANSAVTKLNDPQFRVFCNENSDAEQIGPFFECIENTTGQFIAVMAADDLYEAEFLEHLVRAHVNPVIVAAVSTCETGLYRVGGGLLSRSHCGFRNEAKKAKKFDEHEVRLATVGYSDYVPSWRVAVPWKPSSGFLFRRDVLELLRPRGDLGKMTFNTQEYCIHGAHVLGGGVFVDRLLSWRGIRNVADRRDSATFSQFQRNISSEPVYTSTLKQAAINAFFENKGASYISAKHFGRMLTTHFTARELHDWSMSSSQLSEVMSHFVMQ